LTKPSRTRFRHRSGFSRAAEAVPADRDGQHRQSFEQISTRRNAE
jgi:hypothetical protein